MDPVQIFKNIVEKIIFSWKSIRNNSHNISIKNSISNKANNALVQAEIVKIGYNSDEVTQIVTNTLNSVLPILESKAKDIYKQRTDELENKVNELLLQLPQEDVISKLSDPEMQLALKEATLITGKKQDKDLRDLLSRIVFKKIQQQEPNKETLKNLVYTEAIRTMDKVTPNQVKIITLCYLIKYTQNKRFQDWTGMKSYFENSIKPFLNFHSTTAEYQHIEYAGCGTLSNFGTGGVLNIIKDTYAFLFVKPLSIEQITKTIGDLNLYPNIFIKINDTEVRVVGRNKQELEEYLKQQSIEETVVNKITNLYEQQLSGINVEELVKNNAPYLQELVETWKSASIDGLTLTSVGIVIGALNYEQTTGNSINIDEWIN